MMLNELRLLKNALTKPNLWSYISLFGAKWLLDKAQGKANEGEKRRLLEYMIQQARLDDSSKNKINYMFTSIETALKGCGFELRRIRIKAISRGLIGGSETFGSIPFEVGLYFDPIMNVPYIPGSTIKGAVRSATFDLLLKERVGTGRSSKGVEEEVERECVRIFGGCIDNEDCSAGLVGFTDAYPIEGGKRGYLLYPDVMTPHYKDNVKSELDVSPTPIIYLTIAPGTKFQFYIFYRKERGGRRLTVRGSRDSDLAETPIPDLSRLGIVDRGLLYAFYRGVGAKTAVGYSRFEIVSYENVG
ncbi:type III-B CRISPR module RAMP protein Cmr6 [Desulfurococcaceae archaeon AG1]|jgi:CRISPR-associated protein Cmr6|nr:type III-B CRISPR module RAMP protein Cmr6 [Desulfurococcaceae archaeon AG1]